MLHSVLSDCDLNERFQALKLVTLHMKAIEQFSCDVVFNGVVVLTLAFDDKHDR